MRVHIENTIGEIAPEFEDAEGFFLEFSQVIRKFPNFYSIRMFSVSGYA